MIGVLVSGEGTNLQALLDAGLPVAAVASNRPGARALERAARGRGPGGRLRARLTTRPRGARRRDGRRGSRSTASTSSSAPGYMHLLPPAVPRALPRPDRQRASRRCSRPSPARTPIEDVLAAGVRDDGVTVHYVDEGVDTGPVIAPGAASPVEHRRDARASASTRSSTGCCHGSSRSSSRSCAGPRADLRLRQDRARRVRARAGRARLRARRVRRHGGLPRGARASR